MSLPRTQEKILNLLTMCRKAGKMALGFDPTAEALCSGKLSALIFASDLSPKTRKEAEYRLSDAPEIPVFTLELSMEELQTALGKRSGILGICDEGFAKALSKLFP